jgi:glycosyltransferase involved in cell wall biosynthesis
VGAVDDVRPELERAWVALAPLRKGSGSPLKVLEALAMGVPVVATPRVARSLELGPRDGVVTADGPEDIAHAAAVLLGDDEERSRLAGAGESTVHRRFDSVRVAAALEREWVAAARRGRPA